MRMSRARARRLLVAGGKKVQMIKKRVAAPREKSREMSTPREKKLPPTVAILRIVSMKNTEAEM
jgi:hypothetical protein